MTRYPSSASLPSAENFTPGSLDSDRFRDLAVKLRPNAYDTIENVRLRDYVLDGYSLGTLLLAEAAQRDGATIDWVRKNLCVAKLRNVEVLLYDHRSSESAITVAIERDKHVTSKVLQSSGVNAPTNIAVRTPEEAVAAWRTIGGPAVVKPRYGMKGLGITVGVNDAEGVKGAFAKARRSGPSIVVEEYIEGEEYRLICSDTRVESVLARIAPHVVGDGRATIGELIDAKNRLRWTNPHTCNRLIRVTSELHAYLRVCGRTLDTVPEPMEFVQLLNVTNFSQGGDSFECTDLVADEIKRCGTNAVAAIPGLSWGAVDVRVDRRDGRPYVLEVNTNAALSGHVFPVFGRPTDVAVFSWRVQYSRAKAEPRTQSPVVRRIGRQVARKVSRDKTAGWAEFESVRLSRYVRRFLARSDGRVVRVSNRLRRVEFPSKGSIWLSGALTDLDKQAAVLSVTRFLMQQKMLQRSNVPHVGSEYVRTSVELTSILEEFGSVNVVHPRGDWHDGRSISIDVRENLDEISWTRRRGICVQERLNGQRFRVLADRDRVYAIFAIDAGRTLGGQLQSRLAQISVAAVRSVPELRWSGVDMIVSDYGDLFVEGMTLNPWLPASLTLIGGGLEDFLEAMFSEKTLTRRHE